MNSALRVSEAVELAHPLVARSAADVGVRVLFIKGASLAAHGLRDERQSSDVDALVAPADESALVGELRAGGWHEREKSRHGDLFTVHSATLIHDGWPCDLDIHRMFPGFLADPAAVFEVLWSRRVVVERAGWEVAVPDRPSSILVLALHSLRGGIRNPRHARELEGLVERLSGAAPHELAELAALARETGCLATLAPFFARIGAPVDDSDIDLTDPDVLAWRRRVESGSVVAHFYLELAKRLPLRRLPGEVARALWPSSAEMRIMHPEIMPGQRAVRVARLARLGRGIRDIGPVLGSRLRIALERRRRGERR